jgi:hypothetical protein
MKQETKLHRYVLLYNQQLQQNALAGTRGLAQTAAGHVQETTLLPARM